MLYCTCNLPYHAFALQCTGESTSCFVAIITRHRRFLRIKTLVWSDNSFMNCTGSSFVQPPPSQPPATLHVYYAFTLTKSALLFSSSSLFFFLTTARPFDYDLQTMFFKITGSLVGRTQESMSRQTLPLSHSKTRCPVIQNGAVLQSSNGT